MKKISVLLLTILLIFGMTGCSKDSDKDKLIGTWVRSEERKDGNASAGTEVLSEVVDVYAFDKNGHMTEYVISARIQSIYGLKTFGAQKRVYEGNYKINSGKIIIKYEGCTTTYTDENLDIETETEEYHETETIPYYINEYTHELVFDSDSSGNTDYRKRDENFDDEDIDDILISLVDKWYRKFKG